MYEEGTIKLTACPLVIGLWQQPTIPVNHGGGNVCVAEGVVVEDIGMDGVTDALTDTDELGAVLCDTDVLTDADELSAVVYDADELAVAVSVDENDDENDDDTDSE